MYKQAGTLKLFQLVENLQNHIEYSVLLNETTQIVNKMTQIIQDRDPDGSDNLKNGNSYLF